MLEGASARAHQIASPKQFKFGGLVSWHPEMPLEPRYPTKRGKRQDLISHKVSLKSFCRSQFPQKIVNVFFILVIVNDKLTDWPKSTPPQIRELILHISNSKG